MANEVLIVAVATLIVMGFALELATIAEDVSGKAIGFSEDMSNAMDCAIEARPIEQCSPALMGQAQQEFKTQATSFVTKVEEIQDELEEQEEQETPEETVSEQ